MEFHLHVHNHYDPLPADARLDRLEQLLTTNQQYEEAKMSQLDDKIQALTDAVAAETTVNASAVTLLNGIPGLIADAIAKASGAGATPAQLQAIQDLADKVAANKGDLAAAVTAGTPGTPAYKAGVSGIYSVPCLSTFAIACWAAWNDKAAFKQRSQSALMNAPVCGELSTLDLSQRDLHCPVHPHPAFQFAFAINSGSSAASLFISANASSLLA